MTDTAVVSGASRGIGLAISQHLAGRGFTVAMLAPASSHLEQAAETLGGGRGFPVDCDVTDAVSVDAARDKVLAELGTPRVVVANAGIVRRGPVHELDVADFDEIIAVNLRGTFLIARAFVGAMREQRRGRFVAIASISATLGTANASAYNASKWGVVGFVKSLAEELRGTGVQALALNPGAVDTDMLRGSPYAAQMSPDDVAKLAIFAALDAPDAMNGAALDIFGP
jgi:3-oxoacyl-[acyl-carrier protein] reductase